MKSERGKQISSINAHMWKLEKWYLGPYLQGRERDMDIESGHVDTVGEEEWGMNWAIGIDIYTTDSCVDLFLPSLWCH